MKFILSLHKQIISHILRRETEQEKAKVLPTTINFNSPQLVESFVTFIQFLLHYKYAYYFYTVHYM